MRTIVAGSRNVTDIRQLHAALIECGWVPSVIISGGARGADRLGEEWAKQIGLPLEIYPADWDHYGKSAGHRRNAEMAAVADALIALWDGQSRGTKGMIDLATARGLRVFVRVSEVVE